MADEHSDDAIYLGQLAPLTDRWLAPDNGYHIVSDSCRPHRDVDELAGWMADELVFEVALSACTAVATQSS